MYLKRFNSSLLFFIQRTIELNINLLPWIGFIFNSDYDVITLEKVNCGFLEASDIRPSSQSTRLFAASYTPEVAFRVLHKIQDS